MTWQALEEGAPELAGFGARRLTGPQVAYLATVGEDGTPRVHPVTPIVGPGRLFVFMEPTSPKGHDLERGSRYALHCAVEDPNGGGGEFRVRGSSRRVLDAGLRAAAVEAATYQPAERYVLFELLVDEAFSTAYDDAGEPVRQTWSAARVELTRRAAPSPSRVRRSRGR